MQLGIRFAGSAGFVRSATVALSRIAVHSSLGPAVLLGVVALCVRWVAWQRTGVMFNDGPIFIGLAQLVADGQWGAVLAHPFHPGYPAAIAAMHALFGLFSDAADWEAAGVTVSMVSGALSTGLLFVFFRDAFGLRIATVAGLLLAVHPHAVAHSSDVQSDGLYVALFLAAITALWWSCRELAASRGLLAGAMAGLAYWVRPEGLGVALVGAVMAMGWVATRRCSLRRGAVFAGALLVGAMAVAGPYMATLRVQTGEWMVTRKKSKDLSVTVAPPSVVSAAAVAARPFLDTVVHGPREPVRSTRAPTAVLGEIGAATAELANTFVASMRPELVILAVIGLTIGIRRRVSREIFLALLSAAYLVLLIGLVLQAGYVSKRHTLPIAIIGLGYAAAGATVLGGWLLAALRRVRPAWAASWPGLSTAMGVGVILAISVPSTFAERRANRVAERFAAEWLATHEPARGAPVAAGKQRIAYYANAPFVRLPDPTHSDALSALRGAGARYLIIDEHYLEENAALRRAAASGMRELHRIQSRGHTATIYAIDEPGAVELRLGQAS